MDALSDIIKIAKYFISAKQSKKLLQYLKNDCKEELTQEKAIEFQNKIKQIQQKSFNFVWFTNKFIKQHKHYQDIDVLLDLMQSYKNLNKQLKTFQFNKNTSFGDLYDFMNKFKSHQIKNKEFSKPQVCKEILKKGNYIFYYADANNKECFNDLHECNMIDPNKEDNRDNQYAKWCVVIGSVDWGTYTTSEFPFYVYVTDLKNQPIMFFNFGYTNDAQIKDIHDHAFTQYDQELIEGIKQLAQKYDFDIQKNTDDFDTFNKVDELYYKQLDINNIDQKIINESQKYNDLNFIEKNIVYDFKKNQKAYLIANDNIINLKGYKIDINLLNLLQDNKYHGYIVELAKNYKFINNCSNQIFDFIINFATQYKSLYYSFHLLIYENKIKDENKVNQIIQVLIDKEKFDYLYDSIFDNKIKDENKIKQIIQAMIDNEKFDYLSYLINYNKIKDENQFKQIIQLLIDNKQFDKLFYLIKYNKTKNEEQLKQIIQLLIDNKRFNNLYELIDTIKDEELLEKTIQFFIDNKKFDYLSYLINYNKIKDEDKVKQIIQFLIDNKRFNQIYDLIKEDKIKYEEQLKKTVQFFIDNKQFDKIYKLIKEDKIKDEEQLKKVIQFLIDNNQFGDIYDLIYGDKIKYENQLKQIIQKMIDDKMFAHLSALIIDDKIKDENKVNQIIQKMIDDKQFDNLSYLIKNNKIKDQKLLKKIEEAKNKVNIKTSSISRKLFDISKLIIR